MKLKPNKARIKLWVKALRSGKYKQGKHRLMRVNPVTHERQYCCLGVACLVARQNGGPKVSFSRGNTILTKGVSKWFGLDSPNPMIHNANKNHDSAASWLNDGTNQNFESIADAIEYTYLGKR